MRSPGSLIASGRTADVYSWEPGKVIKLYHPWFELEAIQYEQRIARAVQETGLPVPMVGEILQVDGRNGLVYQRVEGRSMLAELQHQPWRMLLFARRCAELHVQLHSKSTQADIQSMRPRFERRINQARALPNETRQRLLTALARLPDSDRLCHGDFHPGNILMTDQGEVIIDWIDAWRGNPLADLARTSIIILGATATAQIPQAAARIGLRLFHRLYLNHYFKLRSGDPPGGWTEYRRWLPVIAAIRLTENIPELETWLLARAELAGR